MSLCAATYSRVDMNNLQNRDSSIVSNTHKKSQEQYQARTAPRIGKISRTTNTHTHTDKGKFELFHAYIYIHTAYTYH